MKTVVYYILIMPIQDLENYFTSGARSAGYRFYSDGKVSISQPSDIEITAYVKPNFKVTLKTISVANPQVFTLCSCPDFKKGRLCKHAWAAILATDEKAADFLENKSKIEISKGADGAPKTSFAPKPPTQAQIDAQAAYKAKQNEYRKQQYQKQKQRLKDFKESKKKPASSEAKFPKAIEVVLSYFLKHGFDFKVSLNEESILRARKKLSRVFHPDIGGTHEEIQELNKNSELLLAYLKRSN